MGVACWLLTTPTCGRGLYCIGIPVSYRDVESIDPEYAKNLQVREKSRIMILFIIVVCSLLLLSLLFVVSGCWITRLMRWIWV